MPDTKHRILLVDDEPFILELMRSFLDERLYQITTASCGKDAFDLIKRSNFDAVISDIRMPNGTGADLLAWVRELNPIKPPILFVTGYSDVPPDELLARGADNYVIKPFNVDDFAAVVGDLIKEPAERLAGPKPENVKTVTIAVSDISALFDGTENTVALGRSGMFVTSLPEWVKPQQTIAFDLQSSNGKSFSGFGRVMWQRKPSTLNPHKPGSGILFTGLEPASLAMFLDFITTKKPSAVVPKTL